MQEQFIELCEDLEARGYRRNDCTITGPLGIALSFLLALPFIGVVGFLFSRFGLERTQAQLPRGTSFAIVLLVAALLFALVHELVRGAAWALFSRQGLRAVGFGRQGCRCRVALPKRTYLCGVLAPPVVLGLATTALLLLRPGTLTLLFAFISFMACGSDLLLALCLAGEKGTIIVDNPDELGYSAFGEYGAS